LGLATLFNKWDVQKAKAHTYAKYKSLLSAVMDFTKTDESERDAFVEIWNHQSSDGILDILS
jgi:hypothetical protein